MSGQAINFAAGRKALRERPAREAAAQAVADQLFRTEAAGVAMGQELAALFSSMLEQRAAAGLSATVGQELLAEATAAQALIVEAFGRLNRVHEGGLDLARRLGVTRSDFGDGGKPPGHPNFMPDDMG